MLQVSFARAFKDNYIWLIHAPGDRDLVVAVDPGQDAPVRAELAEHGLTLGAILATHHHHDHVGGIAGLRQQDEVPVFGPRNENIPGCDAPVGGGDTVRLESLGLTFRVLDIPGHTAGHIAFVGHGALFCGDTLFSAGCGRLFEGTPAQMVRSLASLAALPDDTRVYCGHEYTQANLRFALTVEPDNEAARDYSNRVAELRARAQCTLPSTMGLEKDVNPFLRCDQESIRAAVATRTGDPADDIIATFAGLRAWKDQF